MSDLSPDIHVLPFGDTATIGIDCRGLLNGDETITGTPTVTELTTSDLSFTSVSKNSQAREVNQQLVPIGQAVTCLVSGQKKGVKYTVRVRVSTSGGQSRSGRFKIVCPPGA